MRSKEATDGPYGPVRRRIEDTLGRAASTPSTPQTSPAGLRGSLREKKSSIQLKLGLFQGQYLFLVCGLLCWWANPFLLSSFRMCCKNKNKNHQTSSARQRKGSREIVQEGRRRKVEQTHTTKRERTQCLQRKVSSLLGWTLVACACGKKKFADKDPTHFSLLIPQAKEVKRRRVTTRSMGCQCCRKTESNIWSQKKRHSRLNLLKGVRPRPWP